MLLEHLDFQVADFPASAAFYDVVLGALGCVRLLDYTPKAIGYGHPQGEAEFWISNYDGDPALFRESHVAFRASSREQVNAFEAAAVNSGVEVLHAARAWPEYEGGRLVEYYAAFVRDPDGNNVEAAYLRFS
jgi:catechol 2,3-dioxygenase-like lactoylglutathione lyase family enzyme